jgi:hypothetical protein
LVGAVIGPEVTEASLFPFGLVSEKTVASPLSKEVEAHPRSIVDNAANAPNRTVACFMDNFRLQILNGQARRHEVISAGESVPRSMRICSQESLNLAASMAFNFCGDYRNPSNSSRNAIVLYPAVIPLFYIASCKQRDTSGLRVLRQGWLPPSP